MEDDGVLNGPSSKSGTRNNIMTIDDEKRAVATAAAHEEAIEKARKAERQVKAEKAR